MEPNPNYDNTTEAKMIGRRPTAGQYILSIHNVELAKSKKNNRMLRLQFDIADGDFKYYYSELSISFKRNMYLKHQQLIDGDNSLRYFKCLMKCIERSNTGFKWDWIETKLVGKKVGAILRTEEYRDKKDGKIKPSLKIFGFINAYDVNKNEPAPPAKRLTEDNTYDEMSYNSFSNESYDPDDLPF